MIKGGGGEELGLTCHLDRHVVHDKGGGGELGLTCHLDRHVVHDKGGPGGAGSNLTPGLACGA